MGIDRKSRGARKSSKRFGSTLEPFSVLSVEYAERRGADLADLKGAALVEPHLGLRVDLGRLAHAGYATELVREMSIVRKGTGWAVVITSPKSTCYQVRIPIWGPSATGKERKAEIYIDLKEG